MKKDVLKNKKGITLLALIITIIVVVILAGVAINTLYGKNGIISNVQDVATLSNIKSLEEAIDLYKTDKNIEGKVEEENYPIALNEDGSWITLSQMKNASELAKLPDEMKYTLLNLTAEKGTTNIPSLDKIDYSKFYKLDYTKLNISQEEAENLVIYVDGDTYKVINLAGVKYRKNEIYVIIPLNNEEEPEYITVANNTYKLYGDGTLKALGEKTVNSGYTSSEVNEINYSWDEFDLKSINEKFNNRMNLPNTLTPDWYASHVYFSTGTAYVIDQNNDLWAWGANDYNKLGLGHSFLVIEPTKILDGRCDGKENVKAKKVWAGNFNTFIVDTDGILWACGSSLEEKKWVMINSINGNDVKEIKTASEKNTLLFLILMNDGKIYGDYSTKSGSIIEISKDMNVVEISEYNNIKKVYVSEDSTWFLSNTGTLYACGYVGMNNVVNSINVKKAIKIAENVRDVKEYRNRIIYITNDNKLYFKDYYGKITEINLETNENTVLLGKLTFINNGEMYQVDYNYGNVSKILTAQNISAYYNQYEGYQFFNNTAMNICKADNNKIYIKNTPNITRLGEKASYNMRNVLTNVSFVHGKDRNISIVDRNGKIYESVISGENTQMENVKKIIASISSRYIIKNDGTLWTKSGSQYVQIAKDETNNFNNVKDIYISKAGYSMVFITEEDKIYWHGYESYIVLPQISGDEYSVGMGAKRTIYPKEVTSNIIEQIRDKIKDIEYSKISLGGIRGANTLILTEDGKLYTMSDNKNMSGNNKVATILSGDFTELTIKDGTIVKQILTEDGLSLALLSNGEVYGWGYNTYGILGPKYEVGGIYPTPVKLEGLPANIRYMSLGNGFAIFASKSGEVYGIGKNDYGQLGTGDSMGRTEFVRCTKLEE